ncbi:homologous-pairing protein-like protein 2 [Plenodomus tracheiphilus IPT5]|uniref:Homologous-pairing protein-like protein 2 n=1 Tax=Plenodomus tracheiphilus IPT5 TaxID=1408161 RepID=A0A6A7B6W3_9PLEO|nr:homologous-pairing protein-like protein 2 [Plenodomus tracheiphilus IPT5]
MAPRKKTEEKASGNEASDLVLHYLRKQNRPYSAIDVSANLHNKVTKTAAAKILKDLHEQKQIEGRPAGKQIVYHAIQDANESCTTEQLEALDTQITNLRTETATLQATAKTLRSTLSDLNSTLSTADLLTSINALETERADITARLDALKAGKAKKVTAKEREDVEREWKKYTGLAKKREVIAREMWKFIEDQLPDKEKKEELREAFDLDG